MPTNNSSQEITTYYTKLVIHFVLHKIYIHPNMWNLNNLKLNVDHHIWSEVLEVTSWHFRKIKSLDALSASCIIGCIILVLAQGQGAAGLLHQQRVGLPDGGV